MSVAFLPKPRPAVRDYPGPAERVSLIGYDSEDQEWMGIDKDGSLNWYGSGVLRFELTGDDVWLSPEEPEA